MSGQLRLFTHHRSWLSLTLCFVLVFGLISTFMVEPAEAKSSRAAKIEQVKGTVYVKKAGGTKPLRAYKNMTLNHGDHISTGNRSSVVLKVLDRADEVTIGANSSLYISDLVEKSGNKKTQFSVWSGSMYVKASSMVNTKDEFSIETPTSIMGVRGTHFVVVVDPDLKDTLVSVISGVVQANVKRSTASDHGAGSDDSEASSTTNVFVYPSQQLNIYSDETEGDLQPTIVDIEQLATQISEEIVAAILLHKAEADQENERFIQELSDALASGEVEEPLPVASEEDLQRWRENLQHLVGNIVKEALLKGTVDEEEIEKIIEEISAQTGTDILDVPELNLSEEEAQLLEEQKKRQHEREQLKEEQRSRQQQLKQENEELLQRLEEEQRTREAENAQREAEEKRLAEEEYMKRLSEEERLALEERLKQREEERLAQEEAQQSPDDPTPPANTSGSGSSGGSGGGSNDGSSGGSDEPLEISWVESPVQLFVEQGGTYSLPTQVKAYLTDNTVRYVDVTWNAHDPINTNLPGEYFIEGTVEGYDYPIELQIIVTAFVEISGLVRLPQGETAPQGGMNVMIVPTFYEQSDAFKMNVVIPGGANSADFSIRVPQSDGAYSMQYKLKYVIDPYDTSSGYIKEGFYHSNGTVFAIWDAEYIDVSGGNQTGFILEIQKGNAISGTIHLKQPAPTGGTTIVVNARSFQGYDEFEQSFFIPGGQNSIEFRLLVLPDEYVLEYFDMEFSQYRFYYSEENEFNIDIELSTILNLLESDVGQINLHLGFEEVKGLGFSMSNDSISFNWANPESYGFGPYSYAEILYSSDLGFEDITQADAPNTTITITGLVPDTNYDFVINVYIGQGDWQIPVWSSRIAIRSENIPLVPGVQATPYHDGIRVDWEPMANATHYNVYLDNQLVGSAMNDEPEFTFDSLEPSREYIIRVEAMVEIGLFAKTTIVVETLDEISNLTVSQTGENFLEFTWDRYGSENLATYYSYEFTLVDENGNEFISTYQPISPSFETYTHRIEGLDSGTRYFVEVTAYINNKPRAMSRIEAWTN